MLSNPLAESGSCIVAQEPAAALLPTPLWYCVYTERGKERQAQIALECQGFPTFLPVFAIKRNKTVHIRKLFPSYLFIQLPDIHYWPRVNNTTAVRQIITSPQENDDDYRLPSPMASIASLILQCYDKDELARHRRPSVIPELRIKPNTRVRIINGPLATEEGICQVSEHDRLGVLVTMFNRAITVEFYPADVDPIE